MVTADSATFDWSPPKEDGGSPVTAYRILQSKDDGDWLEISKVDKFDKKYTAKNLEEGHIYTFRIIAVNKVGDSKPLESGPVTPKKPAGKILIGYLVKLKLFS